MADGLCDIGLIGLGVMGRNLALNMAEHGFPVAVYNRTRDRTEEFVQNEVQGLDIHPAYTLEEFVRLLRRPRSIVLMVTAGAPVDAVIQEIAPLLGEGDLLVDGGNSRYTDTDRRVGSLSARGLLYLGMGISGGELGARFGPSMMPGGPKEGFERIRPILEAASAKVDQDPCVAYMGKGSAGHYVKMVHNGIEYGIEQLIAESYDLMRQGLGLDNDALHRIFEEWNQEELSSYLIEITGRIFLQNDPKTGKRLIDVILDVAGQKGTGIWTSQEAMELRVPTPTIDTAVSMRCVSGLKDERRLAAKVLKGPSPAIRQDPGTFVPKVRNGLYAAMIVTYAQGMALLHRASTARRYDLDLESVARIWRGGCIIRAALLEDIRIAFQKKAGLQNLLMDPGLGRGIMDRQADWREVVGAAAGAGIPVPGLAVSLFYFDAYRRERLPANLIQAQRDFFGAHTYERVDEKGSFHTEWE